MALRPEGPRVIFNQEIENEVKYMESEVKYKPTERMGPQGWSGKWNRPSGLSEMAPTPASLGNETSIAPEAVSEQPVEHLIVEIRKDLPIQ